MRILPFIVAVLLIAVCTLGQGYLTQRYTGGTSVKMIAFEERFDELKSKVDIGNWTRVSEHELSQRDQDVAGARNYISGSYRNRSTRQVVSVFLICGFGRDVAVHTPERCFVGAGMHMRDDARTFKVHYPDKYAEDPDPDDDVVPMRTMTFRTARFTRDTNDQDQQTYWAWNSYGDDEEDWAAPRNPRMHYGGGTPLVKVYVTVNNKATEAPAAIVAQEFAKAFMTEVSDVLGAPIEEDEIEDVESE